MTVKIKLDENHYLLSDTKCWIIARGEGDKFSYLTFHGNIESAIESYFEYKMRCSNAEDIKTLIKHQKSIVTALHKALQPLQIRVEVLK